MAQYDQIRDVPRVQVAAPIAMVGYAQLDAAISEPVPAAALNIRPCAGELATIRSFGWRDTALARLVVTEGAIIGVAGSLAGAVSGLAAAAWFAGELPARLLAIAGAAVAPGTGRGERGHRSPGDDSEFPRARAASMISGCPRRQVTLRLTRTSFQLPRSRSSRFR
jgi:FtsX-like permease family protein